MLSHHAAPVGAVQLALLATAAASMGLQGAAVRGLGVALATTYLTGTLTGLVATLGVVDAGTHRVRRSSRRWVGQAVVA